MKTLGQILRESSTEIYILSEDDKRFISSFGSSENPVSLAEFLIFWNSLDESEKTTIMLDYEPDVHPEAGGFKE